MPYAAPMVTNPAPNAPVKSIKVHAPAGVVPCANAGVADSITAIQAIAMVKSLFTVLLSFKK
jgi:hypothetical protein